MKLLVRAALRYLGQVPFSAMTALLGLTLGVISVVAVHQIGLAVDRSLADAEPRHLAGLTHLLTGDALTAADYLALRAAWREGRLGETEINGMVPLLESRTPIGARSVRVIGADWLAYRDLARSVDRGGVAFGELLDGRAVLADRSLGYAVGESLSLGPHAVRVAGVLDTGLGPALLADISLARALRPVGGTDLDFIGVAVGSRWMEWRGWLDALMPGFSAGLPEPEFPVAGLPGAFSATPVASELAQASFARAILFNLGALGLLSLLVAWFLVHEVALIWAERQRPVFLQLDALGVTPAQIVISHGTALALIGVVATLLGAWLGGLLANRLLDVVTAGVLGGTAYEPPLGPVLYAKAACAGLGVCLAGGLPALASAARPAVFSRGSPPWMRGWLLVFGALVLAVGLSVEATGLLGAFAALAGLVLLTVVLVPPVLEGARGLVAGGHGLRLARGRNKFGQGRLRLLARLGAREALDRPHVVGLAVGALVLAMGTSVGVGLMVSSLEQDFGRMLAARLSGELYVGGPPAMLESVRYLLDERDEVQRIAASGSDRLRVQRADRPNGSIPVVLDFADLDAIESSRFGFSAALDGDDAMINERLARLLDVDTGARLRVLGRVFTVVHVFPGFGNAEPVLVIHESALAGLGIRAGPNRLAIHLAPQSVATIEELLAAHFPELEVVRRAAIRERAYAIFNRTFAVSRALTLLTLLVAGIGVYSALSALRLNQGGTRRLLEAQGVTAGEMLLVTCVRAATVGLLAIVLAGPLGIAMGAILCQVVNPRAFGWTISLELAPLSWLGPLLFGLLATVLAGVLPAPREHEGSDATS